MIFAHELSKAKFVYMCDVAQTRYLKTIIHVQYLYKYCYYNAILLSYHIECLLILYYYIIFSYLLGLLAKIKCSISSSQPDL